MAAEPCQDCAVPNRPGSKFCSECGYRYVLAAPRDTSTSATSAVGTPGLATDSPPVCAGELPAAAPAATAPASRMAQDSVVQIGTANVESSGALGRGAERATSHATGAAVRGAGAGAGSRSAVRVSCGVCGGIVSRVVPPDYRWCARNGRAGRWRGRRRLAARRSCYCRRATGRACHRRRACRRRLSARRSFYCRRATGRACHCSAKRDARSHRSPQNVHDNSDERDAAAGTPFWSRAVRVLRAGRGFRRWLDECVLCLCAGHAVSAERGPRLPPLVG